MVRATAYHKEGCTILKTASRLKSDMELLFEDFIAIAACCGGLQQLAAFSLTQSLQSDLEELSASLSGASQRRMDAPKAG